jgi:signal recognition particle receptor subunit beta
MSDSAKNKIYQMLDGIEDEKILTQVMEDVAFYTNKQDITDELTPEQLRELDKAIQEADNNEAINWDDFKKEMNEWRKK